MGRYHLHHRHSLTHNELGLVRPWDHLHQDAYSWLLLKVYGALYDVIQLKDAHATD